MGSFKSWTRGGITTSETAAPPTGYTKYYDHVCEDADNSNFRQESISLFPGQTLQIQSYMRIPGAEDLSGEAPTISIVDPADDPLWCICGPALDTSTIPVSDGSVTAWQAMPVLTYKNTDTIAKEVIVRAMAKDATATVGETWSLDIDQPAVGDVRDGTSYDFGSEGTLELPDVGDVETSVSYGEDGTEFTGTFAAPAEVDVETGVGYGEDGTEFTGACDVPVVGDVRFGVAVDASAGTCYVPDPANVRDGIPVDDGVGTCSVPTASQTLSGVAVDATVGNVTQPSAPNVRSGISYGASGTQYTGTFDQNVRDKKGNIINDGIPTGESIIN